jgi:hypothetical protein
MNITTKVLAFFTITFVLSTGLFAKPPTQEKINEFMKLSGTTELIDAQAQQSAKRNQALHPKKSIKSLKAEQVEVATKFISESVAQVFTDEDLDKRIVFLKTADAKDYIKMNVKLQLKNMARLEANQTPGKK